MYKFPVHSFQYCLNFNTLSIVMLNVSSVVLVTDVCAINLVQFLAFYIMLVCVTRVISVLIKGAMKGFSRV